MWFRTLVFSEFCFPHSVHLKHGLPSRSKDLSMCWSNSFLSSGRPRSSNITWWNILIGQALQNCETLCIAQASALPEARFCKNPFMERPIAQLSWEIKAKKMDKLCRASTGHWGSVIDRRREKNEFQSILQENVGEEWHYPAFWPWIGGSQNLVPPLLALCASQKVRRSRKNCENRHLMMFNLFSTKYTEDWWSMHHSF